MLEHLSNIAGELPYILQGAFVTLIVVMGALSMGFVIGIPLSLLHVYGSKPVRWAVGLYVWFFRGTPILVLLYLFYFGLFIAMGLDVSALTSSCIVLGLTSAAYQSQIFRGAIESLPSGQLKAARALGMYDSSGISFIILPQAIRLALPGWSNEFSILLKDSALIYLLGASDIMARIHQMADSTQMHFTFSIVAGVLYFLITMVGLRLLKRFERKIYIPGYQHG